jgi:xylulokinase
VSKKYIMGIDFGTTGTKAVIYDPDGNEIGQSSLATSMEHPKPGWVTQDAQEIVDKSFFTVKRVIEETGISNEDIVAIGITHVCTTCVPVDKDGNFLYSILSWQDMRGVEMFPYMRECWEKAGYTEEEVNYKSGMILGSLPTLSKVLWYRENEPELWGKTDKIIGMQAMLNHALTGTTYYDDKPNITQTMLASPDTDDYDLDLMAMYGIDRSMYPDTLYSTELVGTVSKESAAITGLKEGTPVYMAAGDCRVSPLAVGVTDETKLSMTLGTIGVFHAVTDKPLRDKNGKLYLCGNPVKGKWQFEAFAQAGAACLEWFKENFCQLEEATAKLTGQSVYTYLDELAGQSPLGARGLLFGPWLNAASCIREDFDAMGTFVGLTYAHNKGDMVRSVMEGVCFEMKMVLEALQECTGSKVSAIRSAGGGSKSDLWNQMQADIYNLPIELTMTAEATSLGAAMCAAVGHGFYKSLEEASENMVKLSKRYEPIAENVEKYRELAAIYEKMYESTSKVFPILSEFHKKHY